MYLDHNFLKKYLEEYTERGLLRKLEERDESTVDFSSNDYLGLARSDKLYAIFLESLKNNNKKIKLGSTGSRLISGNSSLFSEVEQGIASFHRAEAGLIFNSGYNANIGIFSSIPQKNDVILYDALCHASIRDGIRLSFAKSISFQHNNMADLEKKIKQISHAKQIYIATEALYSMDGDFLPVEEFVELCKKYKAYPIVDEAHSTGVVGNSGEGLVSQFNLEGAFFARVHTFGKAMGCHGAIVLGSSLLKKFLITKARTFIYTTALSHHDLLAIQCAYKYLKKEKSFRSQLSKNIEKFRSLIIPKTQKYFIDSRSAIQACLLGDQKKIKDLERALKIEGIHTKGILYPSVPKGTERIRICLHSFNTEDEISQLQNKIYEYITK